MTPRGAALLMQASEEIGERVLDERDLKLCAWLSRRVTDTHCLISRLRSRCRESSLTRPARARPLDFEESSCITRTLYTMGGIPPSRERSPARYAGARKSRAAAAGSCIVLCVKKVAYDYDVSAFAFWL